MLLTLPFELLNLVFDILKYSDRLMLRSTCITLRRSYQHRCRLLAQTSYSKDEYLQDVISLEEWTKLVHGIRLRCEGLHFHPSSSYHFPKPIHVRHVEYCGLDVYIQDYNGRIHINGASIAVGKFFFIGSSPSGKLFILPGGSRIGVVNVNLRKTKRHNFPHRARFHNRYLMTSERGQIYCITTEDLILFQGWEWTQGINHFISLDTYYASEQTVNLFVFVTQTHEAFLLVFRDEIFWKSLMIMTNITDIVGVGTGFLLTTQDEVLVSVKVHLNQDLDISFTKQSEGFYRKLGYIGCDEDNYDILAFSDKKAQPHSMQMRIKNTPYTDTTPFTITGFVLDQLLGYKLRMRHATYSVVY